MISGIFKKSDNTLLTVHPGQPEAEKLEDIAFSNIDTEVRILNDSELHDARERFKMIHGFSMQCWWWEMGKTIEVFEDYIVDDETGQPIRKDGQLVRKKKIIKRDGILNRIMQNSFIKDKLKSTGLAWPSLYVNDSVEISSEDWRKLGS
tara:strand:- start:908 stop:1354 length:447 start_codon:yes stop_codon:yes gene_type:complete